MVNEIERIKAEISRNRKALEGAMAYTACLDQKRDEIRKKLVQISRQLHEDRAGQEAAVTQYARGEIDDTTLESSQGRVTALERKEKTFSSVLRVSENDISAAMEKEKEITTQLKRCEQAVWGAIAQNELSRAAAILRGAFVALGRGNLLPPTGVVSREMGFLEGYVYDATFCTGTESYDVAIKQLEKKYLD